MGKQLYFAHIEEDIAEFLEYLEKINVRFVVNGALYAPSQMLKQIESEMTSGRPPQYTVVCVPVDSFSRQAKAARIADGTGIEIWNCRRENSESRTYDKGRLYLRRTEEGTYDENLLALYKKMCQYFKKNYLYHKQPGVYVSKTFKHHYELKKIFLSQLGYPLPL